MSSWNLIHPDILFFENSMQKSDLNHIYRIRPVKNRHQIPLFCFVKIGLVFRYYQMVQHVIFYLENFFKNYYL